MLLGRDDERGRLERLIARARGGRSSALIIHGEPGIGKTSLLEDAVSTAAGFTVLRARSLETESDLGFAGLHELLRTAVRLRHRIPAPQQVALSGALALGPPTPADRFAVAAATLSLLAVAAEESPVLAVVDDAHWLDTPSREALLFAGRRLGNENVLLLLAMRNRDWISSAGLRTLELRGLSAEHAALLMRRSRRQIHPAVRRQLIAETHGNPLALLEAVASLAEAELLGRRTITAPLAVGVALEQAFARQLDGLPVDTRDALLLAAASDSGNAGEIVRALALRGIGIDVFQSAERGGVIRLVDDRIEFRHPLVRSAAYHQGDDVRRRAAHRALAAAVKDSSVERAAWHLAAATSGPDEQVAALLEAAATNASARNAHAAAASTFEASARLSVSDADKLRRMISAGHALVLGGDGERAAGLLAGVVELSNEPGTRADVQALRAQAMLFTRPAAEIFSMLVTEAQLIEPYDTTRAATLFTRAASIGVTAADLAGAHQVAQLAARTAEPGINWSATMALAVVRANLGEVDAALALLKPLLQTSQWVPTLDEIMVLSGVAQSLAWMEQWSSARQVLDHIVGAARMAAAPAALIFPLAALAEFELRLGKVSAAYAAAAESVQLAAETGHASLSSFALVVLARVEAVLGHPDDSRAHIASALEFSRLVGSHSIEHYAASTLGLLELSSGHPDRAVRHLIDCERLERQLMAVYSARSGRPSRGRMLATITQWAADLVEALIRSGATTDAKRSLAVLEETARQTDLRWVRAGAARCRGMLTDEHRYEQEFQIAIELYGEEMAFEAARTRLALGMRRRRSRRRADAREALHDALAYFDRNGAEPWALQVRTELEATGEMPSREAAPGLRSLTPQELQVALIVSQGATTREAAAALFLSPKTVEFHLANTYRKLGVRSRSELVRRVEGLD